MPEHNNFSDIEAQPPQRAGEEEHFYDAVNEDMLMEGGEMPIMEAPNLVKDIPDVWLNRLLPSTEPMKGIDWQKVFGRVFILNDDGVFRPVESERLVKASEKVGDYRQLTDGLPHNLADILQQVSSLPLGRLHHLANTGEYLNLLFSHRQLVDVLIHVNQTLFVAHRVALACHSVYFAKVFILNQHHKHKLTELRLKNIAPLTFCTILRFIYTGRLKVSKKNVRKLMRAAESLQIPAITNVCLHHLGRGPKPPAVEEGEKKEMDPRSAQARALTLLHSQLQDLLHSEAFLRQPVEVVERLLQHDDLLINSEMEVLKLVMAWLAYDLGWRRRHAERVMQHVRFTCMTPAEIIESTQIFNFITYSSLCRTRVLEAVWLMTLKGYKTHDVFNCHCPKPRRHLQEPGPLFLFQQDTLHTDPALQTQNTGGINNDHRPGVGPTSELEGTHLGYRPYQNVSGSHHLADESFNNPNRGQEAASAFPLGMPPAYQDTLHLCTQRSRAQEAHRARGQTNSPLVVPQGCQSLLPASPPHSLSHSFGLPVNCSGRAQPAAHKWPRHAQRGPVVPSPPAPPPTHPISPCPHQPLRVDSGSTVLTGKPGAPKCSPSHVVKRPRSGVDASAVSTFRDTANSSQLGRATKGCWISHDESRNSNADRHAVPNGRLAGSAVGSTRCSKISRPLFRRSESAHLKNQHRLPSSLHLSRSHDSRPEAETESVLTPDHRLLYFKPYVDPSSANSYSRAGKQPFRNSESYSTKTQHHLPSSHPMSNTYDSRPRVLVNEKPSTQENFPPHDQKPFPFQAFVDPSASKASCRTEKSISGYFDTESLKNPHQLPSSSQVSKTYDSRPEAVVSARKTRKGNASPIGQKYFQFKTFIDPMAASLSSKTENRTFRNSESVSMKTHHFPSSPRTSKPYGLRPKAVGSVRQSGEEDVSPLVQMLPSSKASASPSARNTAFQTEKPQLYTTQSSDSRRSQHDSRPESVMRLHSEASVNPSAQSIPFTSENPLPQRSESYICTNQHCSPSDVSYGEFSRPVGSISGFSLNQKVLQKQPEMAGVKTTARKHPVTRGSKTDAPLMSLTPSFTGSVHQQSSQQSVFMVPEGQVTIHKAPAFVSHSRPPSRSPNPVSKVVLHPNPPPPPPLPPSKIPPPPEFEEVPLFMLHSSRFHGPGLQGDMTSIEVNFEQRPVPCVEHEEDNHMAPDSASNSSLITATDFREGDLLAVGGFVDSSQRLGSSLAQKLDSGHQKWETFSEIPETRVNFAAAFVKNKLCVCGGYDPNSKTGARATTHTFVFDPGLKQWQKGGSMVYARAFHAVCVLWGRLFAMGGQDEEESALKTAEVYDLEGERWSVVCSMASCRVGACAAAFKERVMAVGGYGMPSASAQDPYPVLDSAEWFEPDINRWRNRGSLRLPRAQACLVAVGPCLYLCGGATRQRQSRVLCSIADIDRYDSDTDQWTRVTQLKMARHNAGATAIGTKIYIVGGVSTDLNQALRTVECYDTASKQWDTSLPELPHGAKSIACVVFSG